MVVCDAANDQHDLVAISDGGTGWYAFWCDARNNTQKAQLFGQHFDAAGIAQWSANGELIMDLPGRSINDQVPVLISGGDVMIAVLSKATSTSGSDTVRVIRIDANGDMMWPTPALLSVSGPGIFGNCFGFTDPVGIASGEGAYFCYHGDSQGSNGYYVMQRVRADGTTAFSVPGIAVPYNAGYGPHQVQPDGVGGMIVAWRCSNGAGTCHRAIRVDSLGAALWASNLDVAAGGAGLAFEFTFMADGTGALVSLWEESGGDIGMARFDTLGGLLWTPSPYYACTQSNDQKSPAVALSAGSYYVAWSDNRPPASNRDLYMQKIDPVSGALLWSPDGVLVFHDNSYIPTARIVPTGNGAIGIMDMTGSTGYCAMRMLDDGTTAWSQPTAFATANEPFYGERTELPDGADGVVSFWRTNGGDLYAARIHANGELGDHTGVEELATVQRILVQPNPSRDAIRVSSPERITRIRVFDTQGRQWNERSTPLTSSVGIDITGLPQGVYSVEVATAGSIAFARFVKE